MAAVWGQKLLREIRKRTSELSSDIAAMIEEICLWANVNGGVSVNAQLLENQRTRITGQAAQMKALCKIVDAADGEKITKLTYFCMQKVYW